MLVVCFDIVVGFFDVVVVVFFFFLSLSFSFVRLGTLGHVFRFVSFFLHFSLWNGGRGMFVK